MIDHMIQQLADNLVRPFIITISTFITGITPTILDATTTIVYPNHVNIIITILQAMAFVTTIVVGAMTIYGKIKKMKK